MFPLSRLAIFWHIRLERKTWFNLISDSSKLFGSSTIINIALNARSFFVALRVWSTLSRTSCLESNNEIQTRFPFGSQICGRAFKTWRPPRVFYSDFLIRIALKGTRFIITAFIPWLQLLDETCKASSAIACKIPKLIHHRMIVFVSIDSIDSELLTKTLKRVWIVKCDGALHIHKPRRGFLP
jgi:hypothetical protein